MRRESNPPRRHGDTEKNRVIGRPKGQVRRFDHPIARDHRGPRTAPLLRGLGWDHGDHPMAAVAQRFRNRFAIWWLALVLIAVLAAGCRSRVIKVSLTNTSEQPLSAVIVDYPNATFGVNTLAPGKTFQYTIKPLDNGALKIQFTDANGKIHNVAGPAVRKGQEGTIAIRINQDSASAGSTLR